MLPPNNEQDTLEEVLKREQQEGERTVVSLSCKCNWDSWILNFIKRVFKKGRKP